MVLTLPVCSFQGACLPILQCGNVLNVSAQHHGLCSRGLSHSQAAMPACLLVKSQTDQAAGAGQIVVHETRHAASVQAQSASARLLAADVKALMDAVGKNIDMALTYCIRAATCKAISLSEPQVESKPAHKPHWKQHDQPSNGETFGVDHAAPGNQSAFICSV